MNNTDDKNKKPYDRKSAIDAALANAPAQDKGIGGHVRDTALSLLGDGVVGVGEAAVGLANIPTLGRAGKFLEDTVGYDPKATHEFIGGLKTERAQEQRQEFSDTEGFGGKVGYGLKNPSLITNTVAESLPAMFGGGAVARGLGMAAKGLSPVAAGALGEGVVSAGMSAEQIRQQTEDGLLTGRQAALAGATGATTAGFGFAGGKVAQKLGIGDFDTIVAGGGRTANPAADIAGSAAANATKNKNVIRRAGEGALTEGLLEELPQSVSETILQNEALGRPLDEGVTDAAALGLLSGAAMGAGAGVFARNRRPDERLTPTEDMGQDSADYGAGRPIPNNPNPNTPLLGNMPVPALGFQGRARNQFNASPNGEVFTGDQYNEYLSAQQEQARRARDGDVRRDVNDVTQAPQGYEQAGSDPRLPAPDGTDFTAGQDGQVYGRGDINSKLQQDRDAAAERRARMSRGDIVDKTPVPKLSEQMGLDPSAGGLSAAAAIAVDSGASDVGGQMRDGSSDPAMSAWQSGMMDRLQNADQNNSTYARLAEAINNEPASAPEKARLMREADSLPRAEVAAKQIKPNTRVLDEARAQTRAYTPEGDEVQAQWDVVDASDLVTSNTDSFTVNPDYPATRQPRDRTRASSQKQVNEIASKLQPNILGESPDVSTGAPFVGATDNVVDSGNGRSMAIRRVYQEGGEKAGEYRQFVNEQAAKFGLDTDAVNMMQSPVLVRRNISDANRDEFARAANKPTAARMSSTEQATSDAKNLPEASLLSFNADGNMSLYQSQSYLKNFIAGLPSTEQSAMMDESGALSREGRSRIEAAIVQDAYNNSRLVSAISEKLDNDTTNVLRAVTDKAPQISQINSDIKTGDVFENTLARDIADATQAYMDIKNSEQDVDDYLSQDSLFDDGLTDGAKEILGVLSDNRRSAKAIGEYIQQRINEVTGRGNPKQGGFSFDEDTPTVTDQETIANDIPNIESSENNAPTNSAGTQRTETSVGDRNTLPTTTNSVDISNGTTTKVGSREVGSASRANKVSAQSNQGERDTPSVDQEILDARKTYSQVQTEVANEMGVALNEDGEYDITDAQFDTMEGRVRERIEAQASNPEAELAKKYGFNDSNRLDQGELSIPNRTRNIDKQLDSYNRDKAKIDAKKRDEIKAKNTEKAESEKARLAPIKEQAQADYKQYGTAMVKAYKNKLEAQGVNARDFLRDEVKYNPESFLKLSKKFQEEQKTESDKPAVEIEDFGEKITGARKDMDSFYQKEITDDDISSQPLSKIWPKKDVESIENKEQAALATVFRGAIPTKPRKGYKLRNWVETVKTFRGVMQSMLGDTIPFDKIMDGLMTSESMNEYAYHAKLLNQVDREQWSRITKVDPRIGSKQREDDGSYTPFMGFVVTIDKKVHILKTKTRDMSELADQVNELLSGEVKAPSLKFDLYSRGRGDSKSWFITQASDKDKTPLIEFNDRDAARAFLRDNNNELSELWGQHKESVNVKKSDVRSNANRERVGPDHRSGQDVTTEQFMTTFGLRGGQFGNWVKQGANSKDRQRMLNDTYDAFMDLAGVLNIPPEAIGLGGKLAMSFGARGKGRAMAHYEPSQVIINLTKTKGAGSLAHEWFHALDNHFTSFRNDPNRMTSKESAYITYKPEPMLIMKDQNGKPSRMRPMTNARRKQIYEMNKNRAYLPENFMPDPSHKEGVRPQVEEVFADLVETLDQSPMKMRAITIDKGAADGYWSRIIERAARAFEGYVIHKLSQQGARSDFLANVTPEDAFPRNMDRYPYLLESEMVPVAEAFDNLFATIDSKASEDGNGKTLFSRMGQLKQVMDHAKAGAIGSTQTTRQQVIGKLNDKFGKETISKLMTDGKLDIKVLSDFVQDGKLTIPNDVDGLYQNGKATLIADNLSDDMIIPTFLHELGGHGGMQGLMDKKSYNALMKDFDALVKAGDPLAVQAKAMADKVARNDQDALDEYLPYLVTLASRQQAKQGKVAGMINRMVMAVRSFLRNMLGVSIKINSQDILSLAERMVNEVEKQNSAFDTMNAMPQFSDPKNSDIRFSSPNVPARQIDDVRAKFEGTDEWMKAPNGEKSNLNEQQWLQVRTPAFKEWFGDWEGDADNASKVVDGNGEPMVVYHGTESEWSDYDFNYKGTGAWGSINSSNAQNEIYLTSSKDHAEQYGSTMGLFVDIKKPNIGNAIGDLEFWMNDEFGGKYDSIQGMIDDAYDGDVYQAYDADSEFLKLSNSALKNNQDGVIVDFENIKQEDEFKLGQVLIAFNPNQIKSATNNAGTFDSSNPDIRFSRAAGMSDQFDPKSIARESMTRLYDWASSAPPGKLSWWHKTIGTMYNLAQRNPYFKPVFENTEKFINDVSFYAAKASEFAPRLLPQLDSIRDITKSAIGAKDNDAISKPIFEGTLLWGRDLDGKAVLVDDWRKKVMATSKQDRLQMLKDAGKITPEQLTKLASLNNIQANRFINGIIDEEVSAGLVWTDNELKSKFDLSDEQIGLYREFRKATDASLDSLTRSDMLKQLGKDGQDIESAVMEAGTLREAVYNIEQHINSLIQASPQKEKALKKTLQDIKQSRFRTEKLKDDGYAPLSRFGQYTVDVVDKDGDREYFGMFESAYEARKMKVEMDALYGNDDDFTVTQGALSNEEFKLFAGVTPETAELFGEMLGLDATGDKEADAAFQEYLRRTKNNRSAMKRLMHRKGIKGYSEDVGRVLASFIYSNARHTSAALNMGNLDRSISEIPKGEGQLKDAAVKLAQYIKNPQEEGQLIRGWMFAQYLGGSVASAVVNLTQPIAVSFPYLSQFGGAVKSAAELKRASIDWGKALKNKNRDHFEPDLQEAIDRAEADGTLSPQEVHNLLKQASGKNPLRAGDGTKVGDARALAGNALSRVSLAWGSLFSAAEQVNRRVTFVAAYRMAVDQGMADPADFATKSIKETQFVYNKASRMRWGRGAVGGTLMTFKTYTVSYMELMHRLWMQGEKGSDERAQGRKAVGIMIGTLFLLGGAGGLPFMEDAEDLIDGIGQIMGYNFSSKKVRQQFLDEWVGEFAGDFIDGGISSVSGSPTDVSGRLGLGNLIPGTGIFKERTNNTRDALELLGPAGDFVARVASGSRSLAKGAVNLDDNELKKGALEFAPVAVRNAIKGVDMATSGIYKDTKGYKVADVSPVDAAFKGLGFQPRDISKIQEANYLGQSGTSYYNLRASNIRALWAAGVVEGNKAKVADAKAAVKDWNEKNPNQKIVIKPSDIARRVREMKMDKVDRVIKRAPKTGRGTLAQELNGVRDGV